MGRCGARHGARNHPGDGMPSGIALSQGVWDAVGQAITANIPAALAALVVAVNVAGTTLLVAGTCVLAGVTTNATAVFNVLSGSLPTLIGATVAQSRLVATSATAVVTNTVAALSAGTIEDASFAAGFVPSILTELHSATREIVVALQTPNPVPPVAAVSATTRTGVNVRSATTAATSARSAAATSAKSSAACRD